MRRVQRHFLGMMCGLWALGLLTGCDGFLFATGDILVDGECVTLDTGGDVYELTGLDDPAAMENVLVIGQLDTDCEPTCPEVDACLTDVIIVRVEDRPGHGHGRRFEGCGTLIEGAECLLFDPDDSDETYVLSDTGDFDAGAVVEVKGFIRRDCVSTCQEGDGCIRVVRIRLCDDDDDDDDNGNSNNSNDDDDDDNDDDDD